LEQAVDRTAGASTALRGVRILFVLPTLGFAGAERQAFLLARYLKRRCEADVRLVSLTRIDSMVDLLKAEGIPFEFFDLQHGYRSRFGHLKDICRFIAFLRQRRIEIVLPYCMFQNILCSVTWRLGGAKACIWNQRDEGRSRLEPWVERIAVSQIRRFISNSVHGASFLESALGVPRARIDVVPNGVEPPPADASQPFDAPVPADAFTACMVANLHGKKDHPTLIDAWRKVVDRWTLPGSPHLLLAGAFHERHEALTDHVRSLNLESHVHFLGEVRGIGRLLRTLDLAVFSSFNEGVPNAVLEAMAHGLAVVGTDCEGIREAVGDECRELLARPQDSDDLADKILKAAADRCLRTKLGELGRRRVESEFGVERMSQRMTQIILSESRFLPQSV
jgi:glycosyltransferase involved in cell wall biosynthesis